jgi:L-lactate dehydrogenase (cytochrome)
VLAPTGYTRLTHSQGELSVARAGERAGIPYSLSTMSTRSIEEVAAVSNGAKWFQVYTWKDRGLVREMVERAAAAGYEAIILTVDTAVLGRRERDARRGFSIPPRIGPGTIVDGIVHPAWTYDFMTHEPMTFANVAHLSQYGSDGDMGRGQYVMMNFDQKLAWSDVEWLQSVWSGPIVLKGIQTVDDAKRAVAAGVQAIALSNHGGRQLDDAPAPIALVEPVAQAVQGQAEIICDGGVRRGSDHGLLDRAPVLVRDGRGRRARGRSAPAVLPRWDRAHDGTERAHDDRRDRPRPRPLALTNAAPAHPPVVRRTYWSKCGIANSTHPYRGA